MYTIPKPQIALTEKFIDISNNRVLLKYFQNVQMQFMQINNFGLALDDEGEIGEQRPIFLRQLFVPPHLSSRYLSPEQVIVSEQKQQEPDYQSIIELLQEEHYVFILGDPGSGKTTLLSWTMLAFTYSGDNLTKQALGELVPFAIVLRDLPLSSVGCWDDLWQIFIQRNHEKFTAVFDKGEDVLEQLLSSGQALLLFDGLDEITHTETREHLGQAILEGMNRYSRCRFVISSRVVGFNQLQWFGVGLELGQKDKIKQTKIDTQVGEVLAEYYIVPFNYIQAQKFIDNWYQSHHTQQDGLHTGRVTELLHRIQQNDGLGRLSRIPVLLNMISFIHARRGRLPDGRAELYQRISETYLISLDTARGIQFKGRELQFDYIDLCEWLSRIAQIMQEKRTEEENAILISVQEVTDILQEELVTRGLSEEEAQLEIKFILEYLSQRSGLFIPRGKDQDNQEQYAFAHLSFLEYFAARALKLDAELGLEEHQWQELREKTALEWWQETFVLWFEQLDNPRLVAKYLSKLFLPISKLSEISVEKDVKIQLLLANIVMDSGVRLNNRDREEHLKGLWGFYLQLISSSREFEAREYGEVFCTKLWQEQFNAIKVGVEQAKKINKFRLIGEAITDISSLEELQHLESLELIKVPVVDFSSLSLLTQLNALNLAGARIKDISKLASLTKLQGLSLNMTEVSDYSPLALLTQLKNLHLSNAKISDISSLASLTQLQTLVLSNTSISDISALFSLEQLQSLDLSNTPISDISPLASLRQLLSLYLKNTSINDISELANVPKLNWLVLDNKFNDQVAFLEQAGVRVFCY
ncbi:MAG: NACHT domain-containing protein [Methyloprofundus sp.]|nr:NACHT domain-containing protein [Methyloprofundus sp.]